MSLLDDDLYGDVDQFLETYGSDAPTLEQIRALQVRPWMRCWPHTSVTNAGQVNIHRTSVC
jgi:hypothetical protein